MYLKKIKYSRQMSKIVSFVFQLINFSALAQHAVINESIVIETVKISNLGIDGLSFLQYA